MFNWFKSALVENAVEDNSDDIVRLIEQYPEKWKRHVEIGSTTYTYADKFTMTFHNNDDFIKLSVGWIDSSTSASYGKIRNAVRKWRVNQARKFLGEL